MNRPLRRRQVFDLLVAVLRGDAEEPLTHWHDTELWQTLLPIADLHQVVAGLPGSLKALSVWDELPSDVADLLAAVHELNLTRNEALYNQGLQVLECLDHAGISATPLKGLAYQIIGLHADDRGRRLTSDIDILVSNSDAKPAQEVLVAAGYSPRSDDIVGKWRDHHHLAPLVPDTETHGPGAIEVHFRLGPPEHSDLLPARDFLAASVNVDVAGQSVTVPTYTHLLDHAVMHSGIQNRYVGRRTLRLRDALDIGRLWSRARSEGCDLSDLRIMRHSGARKHFGVCLVLSGSPPEELGPLEEPARRYLAQLLWRQSIAERPRLEAAIAHNLALVLTHPRAFGPKLLRTKFLRRVIHRLSRGLTSRPT